MVKWVAFLGGGGAGGGGTALRVWWRGGAAVGWEVVRGCLRCTRKVCGGGISDCRSSVDSLLYNWIKINISKNMLQYFYNNSILLLLLFHTSDTTGMPLRMSS